VLARLGDADATGVLLGLAKGHEHDVATRRSAILALGILAPRLDVERRVSAATGLSDLSRAGDPDTAGIALMSLARLLAADFAEGSDALAARSEADETILKAAAAGSADVRPFAALALGVAASPAGKGPNLPAFLDLRDKALEALRAVASDEGSDPDARGAFCLALGLLQDDRAAPVLRAVASRRGGLASLRADACAGIGLLGLATPELLAALRGALTERSSDELRREAARALGLLGDVSAVPALLSELQSGASDHVLARVSLALGAIGDAASLRPLAALAVDRAVTDATRSLALASLGLVADLERMPSLARLGLGSNYLARTDALHEALSLL